VKKYKKGMKVVVISGDEKGKVTEILSVNPTSQKVVLKDVNEVKRHRKAQGSSEKGEIVTFFAPLPWSKVKVLETEAKSSNSSSTSEGVKTSRGTRKTKEIAG